MLSRGGSLVVSLIFLPRPLTAQVIPVESPSQDPTTSSAPAIYTGDSQWVSLGCYNELGADADARALGATGSYLTPSAATPDNLTVPVCLEACADSWSPNGGGRYTYAGVENRRECYCGSSLSNQSTVHDTGYCNSPCTGDSGFSCGGFGYLVIYQTVTISMSSRISISSPFLSSNGVLISRNGGSKTGMWVGIALGIFFFLVFLILGVFAFWWYHRRGKPKDVADDTQPVAEMALLRGITISTLRPNPSVAGSDGHRNGIFDDSDHYVSPLITLSKEASIRFHRDMLDGWKRGYVPPLSPDDGPAPIEAESSQPRRGTVIREVEPQDKEDGLGSLGLVYIDNRLAELEARETPVRLESPAGEKNEDLAREIEKPPPTREDENMVDGVGTEEPRPKMEEAEGHRKENLNPTLPRRVAGIEAAEQSTHWDKAIQDRGHEPELPSDQG